MSASTAPDTTPTLSPKDVADRLGVAYGTARGLMVNGRIKTVHIGTGSKHRHLRTSEAWLAEFLGGNAEDQS